MFFEVVTIVLQLFIIILNSLRQESVLMSK